MNQTVGQYRILALLGEGGMGAVYAAEDTLLDIKVALKSLRSELTKTPDMVERFREEAKIQVKLNSPHIVKLYTFMRDGQDYYMVMEFVEGRTLGSFIERVGRLNYRDAIQIMNQALDGLEHAHRLGVIHRDIKLNNIMITPEGTVKVMDFGIARVLGSRRLTRAGNIVGTLDYISPEALNGQEITPAADIYSCGIMLYKMVTGSLPFISENDYLLARMHVEVPPPPPSVHIPDLPRKLEEIILKALAKTPADRFQSAGQMAQALDQFLDASENRDQESSSPFWRRFTPGKSTPPPITGRGDGSGARQLGQRSGGGGSVSPAAATANRRIEELMTQNRMREALDLVQRSIQEFPDDTTLRDLRARIEREQRHYEEDLRRSASEIRGYLDRGLAEMALSAAETQLQRYSGEVSLLELLEEARRQVALKQQKAEAATLIEEEIRPLVEEGRFAEAIAIVVEAVSQNPDEPALTTLLGRTIKAQRDVEKRKQILECRQEAEQLASEGLYDQAIARIERTRLGQPDDPSLLTLLRQLLEARDAAKRRADLDRVSRKIDELEGAGRLDDADSALEVALRRFPREQKLQEKRREIQGKIAERKRQDGIRATQKNVALFKDSHDWTKALGELDLAIERLGPDPAFDEIRAEVRAGQKEYRQKVDAAASSVRDQMAAGELESAIVALEDLRAAYPREQVFVRLQLESSQALAEQQRRLRIRTLVEEADRLIAESKADQAAKLLADVPAGMAEVPEIRSAVERAADAKKAELRRAAEKAALNALQDFETSEDWDGGALMLAGVLADHPDIAGLEKKLHEFEAKAEAKRRALACGQAEAGCREDVRRLIERSEWTQALQRIDSTLAEFPEAAQLIAFRKEIDSQYASWTRTQQLNSAVADIERLLGSSRLDEAATAIEREWERFPEAETFLTLSLRLEQLREEEQNQQARRVAAGRASGLIAAHRWDEAASVLAEVEKRLGSDAEIARVRQLLEKEVTAFQAAIGACKSEVDGLVRGNKWQEAVASAEGLLKKYPEADEIRSLLESTNQEFKAWRRAKELERALQALRGLIDGGRWAEARSASESGRQRFPEADAEFAALADQAAEAAAAAERRAKSATAAERAKRLASERRWAEAVLELDTAEAAYGKDSALESARLSIAAERKKHEDKVSAACAKALKLIDASKWDEARKELSSKAFEGEAEVQRIRGLVEAGRLSEELGKKLSAVEASIAKENWEEVSRLLKAAEAEFPGEPKVASLAAAAQEAEAKQKLEKRIAAVVAEAERQSDPGVALAILTSELQQAGGDGHAGLRAAVSRFEKLKEKRDKALAGVVSKASQMVAKGNAAGAVSYLESVAGEWGQTPEWLAAANDAREAARIAQDRELQQQRERELTAMRAEVTGLVAKGDIARATQYLEGVRPQWGTTQEWAAAWDEVREAAQAARERQLAAITEQTDALIAANDAAGAIRYLAGMQSEWGKTKEWIASNQQAREAARIARELELAAVVSQAKDLIANGDSSGAVRYLDGVKPEWGKTAEWTAAAKEAREAVRAAEERALQAAVAHAKDLLAKGDAAGAVRYLDGVKSEWGKTPEWAAAAKEAREAVRAAEERERREKLDREWAAIDRQVNSLLSKDDATGALQHLEGLSSEWQQTPAWNSLAKTVRDAVRVAHDRELAAVVSRARDLLAKGDAAGAVRYLDGVKSEWGKSPEWAAAAKEAREAVRAAEERERKEKLDREWAAIDERVNSLLLKNDASAALQHLEGVSSEWQQTPGWTSLAKTVREAVRVARERELAAVVSRAKDLLAKGDAAGAVRYLDGVKSEWGKSPEWVAVAKEAREAVRAAEERERREKLDREWAAIDERVNSLLLKDDASAALQHLEGLSSDWQQTPAWNSLAKTVRDAVRVARERELAAVLSKAKDLLAGGDSTASAQYLERVKPEWGQTPEWAGLYTEVQDAIQADRERIRNAEIATAVREIDALLDAGSSAKAKALAEQARDRFPQATAIEEARKRVDAALGFESRINQCLDSAQFDEAETAWIEGANFPSVVALGSEIERRRAAHQRASEDFAFHVRLLIRESRLDEAEQAIQRGTQFKGVVEAVRTELAAERAQAASRQRIGEYRQALERAWTQGDLATASATVQKAVQTDSEAQEVFDWMVEHERQKSEWEQRRKLEQLENRFRRALDANDFKTCEEALEKAKDFPAQEQKFTEWKTALDERKDKARQAEQALRIAGELRQQGNWQGALDALQGVPAGPAWTEAANKARRSIQEAKQAAERAAAAPSFDRTIVSPPAGVSAPAGASAPASVESLSAIPVPDPPAAKKSSMMPLLAAGAVVIVGGGIWLSMGTGKADAKLSVNPTRLEFAGPGVQTVRIESAKPLEYQATGGAETWLSLSAKSGTAPGTLTVEAKPGKLGPGQHRSVIVVQGPEKSAKPAEIEVLLKIDAKTPVATPLVVTPRSIAVSYQVGQAQPAPRRVEIAGVPAAQCKVRITKGGDWLSASVVGAGVAVSFRLSGKVAGSYAGEIEVSSANSEAPVRVPVNLTIQAFRL